MSFPDDISTLWGPDVDGALTPAPVAPAPREEPPAAPALSSNGHGNGNGNGNGNVRVTVVGQDTRDDVARLAEALAANHADVVHQADLDAARAEVEGAFTHQIAVALYELMAASNARFATAEDHIDQRVTQAVERSSTRLETSLEKHHRAAMEMSEFLWAELDAVRQRLNGPIDGLVAFQRELRHEVGRLGDAVTTATDAVLRAEGETVRQAGAGAALAERLDRSEARATAATGELGDLATTLTTMREDMASLGEQITELRQAVEAQSKQRGSRLWSRNR